MTANLAASFTRIADLWTAQDWSAWPATTADGYRFNPGIGPERDLEATLAWSRGLFAAFPDYTQSLTHVFATDATAVGLALGRGTHTGVLDLGLGHALPPT